jgi:isoleucyl-tRNA synthetase
VPDAAGLDGAYADIIRDELNLKHVDLQDAAEVSAADYGISQSLAVNARAVGPRLGKQVQAVIKAAKSGDWSVAEDGTVVAGGIELAEGEYSLQTTVGAPGPNGADGTPDDGAAADERAVAVVPGGFLVLDTAVSAELAAEGAARDVIRAVQAARKDAGLEVSDRVRTVITGPAAVVRAVDAHRDLVCGETLTVELALEDSGAADPRTDPADDATKTVQVAVARAAAETVAGAVSTGSNA